MIHEVKIPTGCKASVSVDNEKIVVLIDPVEDFVKIDEEDKKLKELEALIENRIGKKVEVEVRHVEEGRHFEDTFVDIEQKINMEITVED